MRVWVTALAIVAAGCGREPTPTTNGAEAPVDAAMPTAQPAPALAPTVGPRVTTGATARSYLGRWTGVEGMVLDVSAGDAPDRFKLVMQYDLDHRQTAVATLNGNRLVFTRDGAVKALHPTDGKATGLKYLVNKTDCLTVAPGEGYCRD